MIMETRRGRHCIVKEYMYNYKVTIYVPDALQGVTGASERLYHTELPFTSKVVNGPQQLYRAQMTITHYQNTLQTTKTDNTEEHHNNPKKLSSPPPHIHTGAQLLSVEIQAHVHNCK